MQTISTSVIPILNIIARLLAQVTLWSSDRWGRATSGIRTHDLTFTKRPLCQLSYGGNGRHYTSRR